MQPCYYGNNANTVLAVDYWFRERFVSADGLFRHPCVREKKFRKFPAILYWDVLLHSAELQMMTHFELTNKQKPIVNSGLMSFFVIITILSVFIENRVNSMDRSPHIAPFNWQSLLMSHCISFFFPSLRT